MPEAPVETTPPALPEGTVVVAVQSAPWWKSRTLWVAAISELINLLSAPALVQLVGAAHATQIVGTITVVLMAVMRIISFAPLTGTPGVTAALAAHPAALLASEQAATPTLTQAGQ